MKTLVRAVITGFGLALGKLIFEKVQEKVEELRVNRSGSDADDIVDAEIVDHDDQDVDASDDDDDDTDDDADDDADDDVDDVRATWAGDNRRPFYL